MLSAWKSAWNSNDFVMCCMLSISSPLERFKWVFRFIYAYVEKSWTENKENKKNNVSNENTLKILLFQNSTNVSSKTPKNFTVWFPNDCRVKAYKYSN